MRSVTTCNTNEDHYALTQTELRASLTAENAEIVKIENSKVYFRVLRKEVVR